MHRAKFIIGCVLVISALIGFLIIALLISVARFQNMDMTDLRFAYEYPQYTIAAIVDVILFYTGFYLIKST